MLKRKIQARSPFKLFWCFGKANCKNKKIFHININQNSSKIQKQRYGTVVVGQHRRDRALEFQHNTYDPARDKRRLSILFLGGEYCF